MLKEAYAQAKQLLGENREALDHIAAFLIEKETITGKEFMKIFRQVKGLPENETEASQNPEQSQKTETPQTPQNPEQQSEIV